MAGISLAEEQTSSSVTGLRMKNIRLEHTETSLKQKQPEKNTANKNSYKELIQPALQNKFRIREDCKTVLLDVS